MEKQFLRQLQRAANYWKKAMNQSGLILSQAYYISLLENQKPRLLAGLEFHDNQLLTNSSWVVEHVV